MDVQFMMLMMLLLFIPMGLGILTLSLFSARYRRPSHIALGLLLVTPPGALLLTLAFLFPEYARDPDTWSAMAFGLLGGLSFVIPPVILIAILINPSTRVWGIGLLVVASIAMLFVIGSVSLTSVQAPQDELGGDPHGEEVERDSVPADEHVSQPKVNPKARAAMKEAYRELIERHDLEVSGSELSDIEATVAPAVTGADAPSSRDEAPPAAKNDDAPVNEPTPDEAPDAETAEEPVAIGNEIAKQTVGSVESSESPASRQASSKSQAPGSTRARGSHE